MIKRDDRFTVGAWVLLLAIVAFSVFQTAKTNSDLAHTQESMKRSSNCTEQFLGATVLALNERTEFSSDQAEANVELQNAQLEFVSTLGNDLVAPRGALTKYLRALEKYQGIVALTSGKQRSYSYPTVEEYRTCLNGS